ncbi:helix-turn-helix transcriptional regulator [Egibacter rhizosphaerae]|nr:helix-turn-helix transcriptional regulator [Egibacter rhizosphaerae]
MFTRMPYLTPPEMQNEHERRVLARNVRFRAVYEAAALDDDAILAHVRTQAGDGEEARVAEHLPLKLAIADDDRALVPLDNGPHDAGCESAVVLSACGLLDALCTLFESVWLRAYPLVLDGAAARPGSGLSADDQQLLHLLQAGLSDRAIARQMGIAQRTLRRRVQRLMEQTGATTRFQLGARATDLGWLPCSTEPVEQIVDVARAEAADPHLA